MVGVRPGIEEQPDRLAVLAEDGGGQGRLTAIVDPRVVRAALEQGADQLGCEW